MANRDAEEIRLNYCKRCGDSLDGHDDDFCTMNKYPAITIDSYQEILEIAEKYNIDLTNANAKVADRGRHGCEEGDIVIDIVACILTWKETPSKAQTVTLLYHTNYFLKDWGYEDEEIAKALKDLNNLEMVKHVP